jgi:redox-regulated HSP33 family molecular chaperone
MLIGLGRQELTSLRDDQNPVDVVCEYCRKHYTFDREQMGKLINLAK